MTATIRLPPALALALALALLGSAWGCHGGPELQDPEPGPTQSSCEGADALAQVWTPARRAELEAALQQVPGEWPRQVLTTIDARVATHGQTWRSSYLRACEQHARKSQRCLDAQVWELDAIVTLVSEGPERAAGMWAEIDAILRESNSCDDRQEPNFDAPALSRASARAWASLRLLLNASAYADASDTIRALELDPTVTQTPAYALPLAATRAIVALSVGDSAQLELSLDQTAAQAAKLGPRAQMTLAQTQALAAFAANDMQAGMLAMQAAVTAARAQEDPWLLFFALHNLGRVQLQLGDPGGALEPLAEAISLSTRLAGAENPHTAEAQVSLSQAQLALERVEAAHDLLTQARDSFVNTIGPDHPQTIATVESIGQLFMAAGRPGDAQYAYLDLLEIYNELYGPKHWRTASVKLALGDTLMAMDQHQGARTMYTEALVPLVQELGAEHRAVIRASIHLGIAELALGNLENALTHCRRGVDLVKALAQGDPLIAEAQACAEQVAAASSRARPKRPR